MKQLVFKGFYKKEAVDKKTKNNFKSSSYL